MILKSITIIPNSLPKLLPTSNVKLVRKKSYTTPSGNIHPIRFPITPPITAPENRPIAISEISRFRIFYVLIFECILDL